MLINEEKRVIMASAYRGGASYGLEYLRWFKEADRKGIKEKNIVGASAGAIFGAMRACGYNAKQMKNFLLKIKGDWIMKWAADVENKKKGWLFKIFLVVPLVRWFVYFSAVGGLGIKTEVLAL